MKVYTFEPPNESVLPLSRTHPLLRRQTIPTGTSVIKRAGIWVKQQVLTSDEIRANGLVEGQDFFVGGYVYEVSQALAAELAATGIGTVTEKTVAGFGVTPFGESAFGDE